MITPRTSSGNIITNKIFLDEVIEEVSGELRQILQKDYHLEFPDYVRKPRIDSPRFFTLTGPTGSGKTLLASYILSNLEGFWIPRLTNRNPRLNERNFFSSSPHEFVSQNINNFKATRQEFSQAENHIDLKTSEYIFVPDEYFEENDNDLIVTSTYPPNNKKYAIHMGIIEELLEAAESDRTIGVMVGGLEMEFLLSEAFQKKTNFFIMPGALEILEKRLEKKFRTEYGGKEEYREEIEVRKNHITVESQLYLEMVGKIYSKNREMNEISFEKIYNENLNIAYSHLNNRILERIESSELESLVNDESIPLVNESDIFKGMYLFKSEMHMIGGWHRISALYLVDGTGNLYLQRRSLNDKMDAGKLDHTISGHVNQDDMKKARKVWGGNQERENEISFESSNVREASYINALIREMWEEGALEGGLYDIRRLGQVSCIHERKLKKEKHHYGVYFTMSDDIPEPQEPGVEFCKFDPKYVKKNIAANPDKYAEGMIATYPLLMDFLKGKLPRWQKS